MSEYSDEGWTKLATLHEVQLVKNKVDPFFVFVIVRFERLVSPPKRKNGDLESGIGLKHVRRPVMTAMMVFDSFRHSVHSFIKQTTFLVQPAQLDYTKIKADEAHNGEATKYYLADISPLSRTPLTENHFAKKTLTENC